MDEDAILRVVRGRDGYDVDDDTVNRDDEEHDTQECKRQRP